MFSVRVVLIVFGFGWWGRLRWCGVCLICLFGLVLVCRGFFLSFIFMIVIVVIVLFRMGLSGV